MAVADRSGELGVFDDLRARLGELRSLASQFPNERAYLVGSEHVAAAIAALEPVVAAMKA